MKYKGIIFHLDGVIVSTDNCHYEAWKQLANEENIYFDRCINERLRGVSRMESLDIILEREEKRYTDEEKNELATRKNRYYVKEIKNLDETSILKGVVEFINEAKKCGINVAVGSSSKNAGMILKKINLEDIFDAVADGNDIEHSKPAPDVFLVAADKLNLQSNECIVVEDADAGVMAALNAKMDVLAVGYASSNKLATYRALNLANHDAYQILGR